VHGEGELKKKGKKRVKKEQKGMKKEKKKRVRHRGEKHRV